eukprot:5394364-Amphidinium_carterae.1
MEAQFGLRLSIPVKVFVCKELCFSAGAEPSCPSIGIAPVGKPRASSSSQQCFGKLLGKH